MLCSTSFFFLFFLNFSKSEIGIELSACPLSVCICLLTPKSAVSLTLGLTAVHEKMTSMQKKKIQCKVTDSVMWNLQEIYVVQRMKDCTKIYHFASWCQ